jgi:Omp85 superfamily domain
LREVALKPSWRAVLASLLLLVCGVSFAGPDAPPAPDAGGTPPPAPPPPAAVGPWYNNLPFLPIPEIGSDPNGGTTVGLLPVWLHTDDKHEINRILAPDIIHTAYFGWGFHGRIFEYPSEDEQWSLVAGMKERVERGIDAQYQFGRQHEGNFTSTSDVDWDRDGTPRFFGIGNNTRHFDQTNYTSTTSIIQEQLGWNLTHQWQLLYTIRKRIIDVSAGTISQVPTIQSRFPNIRGLGTNSELLNRYSIIYDTRDDLTAPRQGMRIVLYGGAASRGGIFNKSLYTEVGGDARGYWPIWQTTVVAAHMSIRYLPSADRLPFWALSSIGGDTSEAGGQQPLRGYGAGRFYDRNAFSASAEVRHNFWGFDAMGSHVDLEVAPFVDLGQVFHHASTFPIQRLHSVGGVGFRAIARPSVVGYVDVGYGNEGAAVFTGLNYPF